MNLDAPIDPLLNGNVSARLPVSGKIRSGIKVLTKTAETNEQAVEIYNRGCAKGVSFDQIEKRIRETCEIKWPLTPRNTPYFKVHRHDFTQPESADKIMDAYAMDLGEGRQLYRFPVVFPTADWQMIMPHSLKTFTANQLKYWSEYGPDGIRLCKTHAEPELTPDLKAKRVFGGRKVILRPENNGICDPLECLEYQSRLCNLTGSILFFIPGIPGTSLIELPTTSFYTMQAVRQQLNIVSHLRVKISGTHHGAPIFYFTKYLKAVSMIEDQGKPQRVKQWITVLESDIDMSRMLEATEQQALLESGKNALAAIPEPPDELPDYDEIPF